MVGFLSGENWYSDIPLLVGGLVAAFVILIFLVALLEKRPLRMARLADGLEADCEPACIGPARGQEFQFLGIWADEDRPAKNREALMLEPGGMVLLIAHTKNERIRKLVTALCDGRWLVTGHQISEADLTGLEYQESKGQVAFWELLAAHHARVQQVGADAVPFEPDRAADEVARHERARANALVAAGLARWRSPSQDSWSYSLRGALRITFAFLGVFRKAMQQNAQRQRAKSPDLLDSPKK